MVLSPQGLLPHEAAALREWLSLGIFGDDPEARRRYDDALVEELNTTEEE